jgi:hypothetical protein
MTLHSLAAYKLGAWVLGLGAGAIFAVVEKGTTSNVQLALIAGGIAAVPPTITGLFALVLQHANAKKLNKIGENVDGILSKAQTGETAALKRADHAEGRREGVESEQERKAP